MTIHTYCITHPQKKCIYNYRFSIKAVTHKASNNPLTDLFSKKITVIYLGKKDDQYRYQFLSFESEFQGNSLNAFSVLQETNALFLELHLSVNASGVIIAIDNLNSIRQKAEIMKVSLLKEHQGNAVADYIEYILQLLAGQQSAIRFLNHDKMFGLFFKGFGIYNNDQDQDHFTAADKTRIQRKAVLKKNKLLLTLSSEEKEYEGLFKYENGHLKDAVLTTKTSTNTILKYTLLCLGSAEKNIR